MFLVVFLGLLCGCGLVHGEAWHLSPGEASMLTCNHNPAGPLNPGHEKMHCSAIVDNETPDAAVRGPWSYTPVCIDPYENSDETSKLCAYTVTNLRGEHGLSIITKPDIAAGLTSMLQHPEISWLENERGAPFKPDPGVMYEVKQIPNKGYGVIAQSFIPKDSIVMIELPYMIKISDPSPWNHKGGLMLMQQAAKRLPAKDQSRLLQMARQDKGYVLDDIFKTNSFRMSVEGVQHAALYPEIARINHDCRPNTLIKFSTQTLALEITAYRDIQPGEEITLSYFALNLLYHQRTQALKHWGFDCSCSFCTDKAGRRKSDQHRDNIEHILRAIRLPKNVSRDMISRVVGKLQEITLEEGLSAQMGDLLHLVANACLDAKDYGLAREIGLQALRVQKKYAGVDNERTHDVVKFLEELDRLEHNEAFVSAV